MSGNNHSRAVAAAVAAYERDELRARQVRKEMDRQRIRDEATRRVLTEETGTRLTLPAKIATLADELAQPLPERQVAIAELLPARGNALLVAQHKTGKTTFMLNLAAALADGRPFLGK